MPHPVLDAAARYRAQLLARERQAATRLVRAYGQAYAALDVQRQALEQAIMPMIETATEADIMRLAALRSLKVQIADQVNRYAVYADIEITTAVQGQIVAGLNDSLGLVQAHFANPRTQAAIAARFDMLPAESVETMLGYTAADSPLRARLVGVLGEAVAGRAADALVEGIATGRNPRVVAGILRRELGQGLTWSLTTARTAQVWAYRDASRLNYMNNRDIVSGWKWLSAADSRTCPSCWAQHGSIHGVDEVLDDHHNGRCTAIPIVPLAQRLGLSEPAIEPGADLFARLPEADQQAIMGPSMHAAWRAGEFNFNDLSKPYTDPVYGDMLTAATLHDLVGASKAKTYMDLGRNR